MRAGTASAAALRASAATTRRHTPQHCGEDEYVRFVTTLPIGQAYQNHKIHDRRRFIRCWPDLQGYLQMDYDWLFGVGHLYVDDVAIKLGRDLGIGPLAEALMQLGFHAD